MPSLAWWRGAPKSPNQLWLPAKCPWSLEGRGCLADGCMILCGNAWY